MLNFPYGPDFQAPQPLVMMRNQLWCLTRSADAPARLYTAAGVSHGLAPVSSLRAVWQRAVTTLLPAAEQLLLTELPRRLVEQCTDAFAYFEEFLAPAFAQRDVSDQVFAGENARAPATSIDWNAHVGTVIRELPAPPINTPTLWLLGRVWNLVPRAPNPGCWQIALPSECLAASGEFMLVASIARQWKERISQFVTTTAAAIAANIARERRPALPGAAVAELANRPFVLIRDLLFLPGTPPRIGHLIPSHYNATLGFTVSGDLAITAPLVLPPRGVPDRNQLAVYRRRDSTWSPAHLPNGLCLGPDAEPQPSDSPGVALAAYLRWAAIRIADNGSFHSSDAQ